MIHQSMQKSNGQSFVELALILPITLVIVVAIYDLAWGMWTYSTMQTAAEEGATYASYAPEDEIGIEARVRGYSSTPVNLKNLTKVKVTIENKSNNPQYCAGEFIEVTVSSKLKVTTPFAGALFGTQNIPLVAKYTSTILTPACE